MQSIEARAVEARRPPAAATVVTTPGGRTRRRVLTVVRSLVALVLSAGLALPLVWMVTVSLREVGQPLPRRLEWAPEPVSWANYGTVFEVIDFARFALNSALIVALAVPITILTASMAGFTLSQLPQRWRLRLTLLSLAALMVPLSAIWLPRFLLFKEAGLIDHRGVLLVPALMGTSPLFVLFFLWSFLRVPEGVYEAARLDGAGIWRIWAGIAMPLARPAVVAVGVLTAAHYWSSFIEPLLYIDSMDKMTLPLGLQALLQLDRTNWPLLMAGAVMVTAPVMLLFLLAQRVFLQPYRGAGWLGR